MESTIIVLHGDHFQGVQGRDTVVPVRERTNTLISAKRKGLYPGLYSDHHPLPGSIPVQLVQAVVRPGCEGKPSFFLY